MLSGLLQPSGGTASVLGHLPWQREEAFRRKISLLLGQKNQLVWDLPARESFALNRAIYRVDPAQAARTIDHLSSLLEVRSLLDQPVRELSLGERMKMELIAALLHKPQVLFLDEPTLGLDVVSQHRVRDFLRHLVAEEKSPPSSRATTFKISRASANESLLSITVASFTMARGIRSSETFPTAKKLFYAFQARPRASRRRLG